MHIVGWQKSFQFSHIDSVMIVLKKMIFSF